MTYYIVTMNGAGELELNQRTFVTRKIAETTLAESNARGIIMTEAEQEEAMRR